MAKAKSSIAFILISLVLIAIIPGCRQCMCCTYVFATLNCTNGSNSFSIYFSSGPVHNIQDSINYYQNQGYTVTVETEDTSHTNMNLTRTCGKENIDWSRASGNTCVAPTNLDGCF